MRDTSLESHPCAKNVFVLMTSFTRCPGTSFTLPRVRSTHGGGKSDGMEDDGCSRATRPVCGGGHAKRTAFRRFGCRLRDLGSDGMPVAAALPGVGNTGDRGKESQAASQPMPN